MAKKRRIFGMERINSFNIARSRVLALFLSIILASTFWFLVNLNKTYRASLKFPAKISGIPDTVELYPQVFSGIELDVEGVGANLMSYLLRLQHDTLRISFSQEYERGFLLPRQMTSAWQGTLTGIRLMSVQGPDSLLYSIDYKVEKILPLNSQVAVNLATSHILESPPSLYPDSVRVVGPKRMLDTLSSWMTEPFATRPLSSQEVINIGILDTFSAVQVFPKTAILQVKPVLYSQTDLSVPIRLVNVPDEVEVKLQNRVLNLTCLVPLEMFEMVQAGSYESVIDFQTIDTQVPYLMPDVKDFPEEVKVVYRSPQKIPYVIVNK